MKKNLRATAIIVAIGLTTIGTLICSAQPEMTVGGYRKIAATDKTALGAAKFAVETHNTTVSAPRLTLVSVISAERQIVAGSNYQMCLALKVKNQPRQAKATVYLNLQNKFALSEWVDGSCGGTASRPAKRATAAALAPDAIVKNLYAAQRGDRNPFFQNESRALVDKYFAKDVGDLIWKDAVESKGEVGKLEADPLYNAQERQITLFKVGKPEYGEGNLDLADVPATFNNNGNAETILFRLERNAAKVWKITDIFYPHNEPSASSLKAILSQ